MSKSIIFQVKSFLGNLYRHLAIFSGHTADITIGHPSFNGIVEAKTDEVWHKSFIKKWSCTELTVPWVTSKSFHSIRAPIFFVILSFSVCLFLCLSLTRCAIRRSLEGNILLNKISGKRNSSSQFETSFRLNENREVKKLKMKFSDAAAVVFNVVVVCVLVVVCSVATASAASFPVKQFPLKQYQT